MRQEYQSKIDAKKTIKRYAITALCTIPLLLLIGYFLGENINRFLRILIFTVILLVAVFAEEFIYAKRQLKKNQKSVEPKHAKEDVFK